MSDDNKVIQIEAQRKKIDERRREASDKKANGLFSSDEKDDDYLDRFGDEDAGIIRSIVENEDIPLQTMNSRHAFISSYGGKPMILCNTYEPLTDSMQYDFRTAEAIMLQYCNQTAQLGDKIIELGRWWVRHANRREYETVFFDPTLPQEHKGCFNLWRGITFPKKQGNWKKIRTHIWKILCNKDKEKFKYVIRWFAWAIQNPGTPAEVALVFKGNQGSGKGTILNMFVKIFGEHGMSISNVEHLTGSFNAHLAKCVFLMVDEAYNPKDRESEGVLKSLITEPRLAIEKKFQDTKVGKNCLHIAMSSNEDWVVPVNADSRRFFINETDNMYTNGRAEESVKQAYFDALNKEINNGGTEAMHYALASLDLKGWKPRVNVPKTEEFAKQQLIGMQHARKSVFYLLSDGIFPGTLSEHGEFIISYKVFMDYIGDLYPEMKQIKASAIRRELELIGVREVKHKTLGINSFLFAPLAELRKRWKRAGLAGEFEEPNEWRFRAKQEY